MFQETYVLYDAMIGRKDLLRLYSRNITFILDSVYYYANLRILIITSKCTGAGFHMRALVTMVTLQ